MCDYSCVYIVMHDALVLFKIFVLMCKKGISKLLRQVAPKPTARNHHFSHL